MVAGEEVIDERTDDIDEPNEPLLLDLEPFLLAASCAATLDPIAPRAESAVEVVLEGEEPFGRFVGVPLTSLSDSAVGSRLMNSFCSN